MRRGHVEDRVVLMPMMIKAQMEGGAIVAVMPAWQLPTGLIVEGANLEDAIENLASRMREHWGGEQNNAALTDDSQQGRTGETKWEEK